MLRNLTLAKVVFLLSNSVEQIKNIKKDLISNCLLNKILVKMYDSAKVHVTPKSVKYQNYLSKHVQYNQSSSSDYDFQMIQWVLSLQNYIIKHLTYTYARMQKMEVVSNLLSLLFM